MADFVYLASQSPRRAQLLHQLGVRHELLLADAAEDAESLEAERPGEDPAHYVERVTRLKLDAAVARWRRRSLPVAPILCADTTVALGRRILGKPADAAGATEMLQALSGQSHRVFTTVALADPSGQVPPAVLTQVSVVQFDAIEPGALQRYVASGEPFGKAGAYAIQSAAAAWIPRIEGSYSGIMGLPLHEAARLLDAFGVRRT